MSDSRTLKLHELRDELDSSANPAMKDKTNQIIDISFESLDDYIDNLKKTRLLTYTDLYAFSYYDYLRLKYEIKHDVRIDRELFEKKILSKFDVEFEFHPTSSGNFLYDFLDDTRAFENLCSKFGEDAKNYFLELKKNIFYNFQPDENDEIDVIEFSEGNFEYYLNIELKLYPYRITYVATWDCDEKKYLTKIEDWCNK